MVLICHNDQRYSAIFHVLVGHSFKNCPFKYFAHFFKLGCLLNKSSLYFLETILLSDIFIEDIFSLSVACLQKQRA